MNEQQKMAAEAACTSTSTEEYEIHELFLDDATYLFAGGQCLVPFARIRRDEHGACSDVGSAVHGWVRHRSTKTLYEARFEAYQYWQHAGPSTRLTRMQDALRLYEEGCEALCRKKSVVACKWLLPGAGSGSKEKVNRPFTTPRPPAEPWPEYTGEKQLSRIDTPGKKPVDAPCHEQGGLTPWMEALVKGVVMRLYEDYPKVQFSYDITGGGGREYIPLLLFSFDKFTWAGYAGPATDPAALVGTFANMYGRYVLARDAGGKK